MDDFDEIFNFKPTPTAAIRGLRGIPGRAGKDGKDGKDGINGINGTNGVDGRDGKDGKDGRNGIDGRDGLDGISIDSTIINEEGELLIVKSNGEEVNLGNVKGKDAEERYNTWGYTNLTATSPLVLPEPHEVISLDVDALIPLLPFLDYVPYTGATDDVNLGTHTLIAHSLKSDASDGVIIEASNGTDIGILGAGNTANVTWYGNHNFNNQTANTIAYFGGSKTLLSATLGNTLDLTTGTLTVVYAPSVSTATETTDTTCFPTFVTASGTQTLPLKTNTSLTYNSNTGQFGASSLSITGTSTLTGGVILDSTSANIGCGIFSGGSSGARMNIGVFNTAPFNTFLAGMQIENTTLGGSYSQKLNFFTHHFATSAGSRMSIDEDGNLSCVGTITGTSFIGNTAASTITGTTLASNVVDSSLTSVGTLTNLTISGNLTVDTNTLFVNATNNRVGILTASPWQPLTCLGNIATGTYNNANGSTYIGYTGVSDNWTGNTGESGLEIETTASGQQLHLLTHRSAVSSGRRVTIDYTGNLSGVGTITGVGLISTGGANSFTGTVVQPTQPSFSAYSSSTQSNVTGDGTVVTIVFGTELYDRANNFSSTTFTAPVGGDYTFTVGLHVLQLALTHTDIYVDLVTSNGTYRIWGMPGGIVGTLEINASAPVPMDAADTAYINLVVSGGSKVVDVFGSAGLTYFAGTLLN